MKRTDFTLQTIRISHKERVTDRFITAQLRKKIENAEGESLGSLLFVVEILSPWYPNAQIGQSIINTVLREYTRGESGSKLVNFELALRKTNEALAQITQHGETEWIGNLSSIIALVIDEHIHLAQTGFAHAYLHRAGKISEITEGLESDPENHPLTTYTNITSGTLENGDELLLASSELRQILSQERLEELLGDQQLDFRDRIRELVGELQRQRSKRFNGLYLALADPKTPPFEETLYIDQSVNHPLHLIKRTYHRSIVPGLTSLGKQLAKHSHETARWSKTALLPTLIRWGSSTQASLKHHTKRFLGATHPAIQKTAQSAINRLQKIRLPIIQSSKSHKNQPIRIPATTEIDQSLAGQTIYRIHHYHEIDKHGFWGDWTPSTLSRSFRRWITAAVMFWKKIPFISKWKMTRRQLLLLGLAILAMVILVFSTTRRRSEGTSNIAAREAASVLADAETLQRSAEQALIFNQIETAKAQFLLAIEHASGLLEHPDTRTAAQQILEKSQAVFDELIKAQRLSDAVELLPIQTPGPTNVTTLPDLDLVGVTTATGNSVSLLSRSQSQPEQTITLPRAISSTLPGSRVGSTWYLFGDNQVMAVDTQANTSSVAALTTGPWPAVKAVAAFRTTLYGLDPLANQIVKFERQEDGTFKTGQPYFSDQQDRDLKSTVDLTIDGAVYTLSSTGTVQKFQRGTPVANFSLTEIPTPWEVIIEPLAIFSDEGSPLIYVVEQQTDTHPARFLAFAASNGKFVRQLLLPDQWEIAAVDLNPAAKLGIVSLTDGSIKSFSWTIDPGT